MAAAFQSSAFQQNAFQTRVDQIVSVSGVSATGAIGTVSVSGAAIVAVTGVSATGAVGTVTVTGTAVVSLTGVSATGAVGTVALVTNANISVTGVSATGAVGTVSVSGAAIVSVTGVSATGAVGTITVSVAGIAPVTGVSATGAVGTVTATGTAVVSLTGVSATGELGSVTETVSTTVSLTGVSATGAVGTVALFTNANISVTGVSATGAVGTVSVSVTGVVPVTGVSATGAVDTVALVTNANISVTGVSATGAVGTVTVTGTAVVPLTGVSATGAVGTVALVTNANISVTGVSATSAVGTVVASGAVVVSLTGVSATTELGDVVASGSAIISLTGLTATTALGSVTVVVDFAVEVTGVEATGFVSSVSVFGTAIVAPTGPPATAFLGSVVVVVDVAVSLTGLTATTALGTVSFVGNVSVSVFEVTATGFLGSVSVSGDAFTSLTGVSSTGATGTVSVVGDGFVTLTGVSASGATGTVVVTGTAVVDLTGVTADAELGNESISVQGNEFVNVSDVTGTTELGTVVVSNSVIVTVTGVLGTTALGAVTVVEGVGVTVLVSGVFATGQTGTVNVTAPVDVSVTGVFATGVIDTVAIVGDANVFPTSLFAIGYVGDVTLVIDVTVLLVGVSGTGQVGQVTVFAQSNIVVSVTGVEATGFVGNVEANPTLDVPVTGVFATGYIGPLTTWIAVDDYQECAWNNIPEGVPVGWTSIEPCIEDNPWADPLELSEYVPAPPANWDQPPAISVYETSWTNVPIASSSDWTTIDTGCDPRIDVIVFAPQNVAVGEVGDITIHTIITVLLVGTITTMQLGNVEISLSTTVSITDVYAVTELNSVTVIVPEYWTPAYIPTQLALWVNGDSPSYFTLDGSNRVSIWEDISGNNRDLVQAAVNNQFTYSSTAFNNFPGIIATGSGSTQKYAEASFDFGTEGGHIAIAYKYNTLFVTAGFAGHLYDVRQSAALPNVVMDDSLNAGATPRLRDSSGSSSVGTNLTPNTAVNVSVFSYNNNTRNLILNRNGTGNSIAGNASFPGSYPTTPGRFLIPGSTIGNDVRIGEVVVTKGAPTDDTRQRIEGYLAWKYNFSSSLVAGHPWKNSPPLPAPAMSWSPAQLASVQGWWDASDLTTITLSGTSVTQWRDKSPNGIHADAPATAPIIVYRGLGPKAVIRFSRNSFLRIAYTSFGANPSVARALFQNASAGSIIAIVRAIPADLGNTNRIIFNASTNTGGIYRFALDWNITQLNRPNLYGQRLDGGSFSGLITGTNLVNNLTLVHSQINFGAATAQINVNGAMTPTAQSNSFGTAGNTSNTPSQSLAIGGYMTGATTGAGLFGGEIAELIISNTIWSTEDRQKLEGYLAWKWEEVALLPSNHPYKTSPPQI